MIARRNLTIATLVLLLVSSSFPAGEIKKATESSAPNANTILLFHFDEADSSSALDASGYDNHGLIRGARWAEGVSGSCLEFDGRSHVEVPDSKSLDFTNAVTCEAWVSYSKSDPGALRIVEKGDSVTLGFFTPGRGGQFWFEVRTHKTCVSVRSKTSLTPHQWFHLAGTYDGETVRLYVNGKLEAAEPCEGNIRWRFKTPLSIGSRGGEASFFRGKIDEVRVSDIARTEFKAADLLGSPRPSKLRITKGPHLQNVTKTSIVIIWETDLMASSHIDYGIDTSFGQVEEGRTEVTLHELALSNLKPDTRYYYRVSSGNIAGPTGSFWTAPDKNIPFRFLVYGDNRGSGNWNYPAVAASMATEGARFAVNTGDVVLFDGEDKDYWQTDFFDPGRDFIREVPVFISIGNHEYITIDNHGKRFIKPEVPNFRKYVSHPATGFDEKYYSFDYGNVHFIVLDTSLDFSPASAQYGWLRNHLEKAISEWTIVFSHQPPYPHISSRNFTDFEMSDAREKGLKNLAYGTAVGLQLQKHLVPLFERFEVDIVFSGHTHTYARTHPIRSGRRNDSNGITYVISGGGGARLGSRLEDALIAHGEKAWHYCIVDVAGRKIEVKVKSVDKKRQTEIIDTFNFSK